MTTALSSSIKRSRIAFTVVELLVAVTIMTLIVLALYGMFDQTQKALRGNMTQVDIFEGGRAAMDILSRELEQMYPSKAKDTVNFYVTAGPSRIVSGQISSPNEKGEVQISTNNPAAGKSNYKLTFENTVPYPVIVQEYPVTASMGIPNDSRVNRTNLLQEIYFLTKLGRDWSGIGYRILPILNINNQPTGVGTLARFSTNEARAYVEGDTFITNYVNTYATNLQRIIDGVVHFKVTPVDSYGYALTSPTNLIGNSIANYGDQLLIRQEPLPSLYASTRSVFLENALPSYLDVELAILEPQALEQLRSLPNQTLAQDFLKRQLAKIHIFRQRILIRNAVQ